MIVTFNPTDYSNLVANVGNPPDDGAFTVSTDESIERGSVRISEDGEGEPETVPAFILGIPPELLLSADEAASAADGAQDELSALMQSLLGDKLIEMNPAELARTIELIGPPPFDIVGNDEVDFGCTRVDGEVNCDPTSALQAGVLAQTEDGTLYVTVSDSEFSA